MAKSRTFRCTVITPERKVLDCDARFVAFPAHDGEMGVLTGRAPLVCKLGIGVLRAETPQQTHRLAIDGGFAQVVRNELTVLTERAHRPEEINAAAAEQALREAQAMKITDSESLRKRQNAIRRAEVQLRLVVGHSEPRP
jgi:F-type H+-transporting ATPase subunit epsilon